MSYFAKVNLMLHGEGFLLVSIMWLRTWLRLVVYILICIGTYVCFLFLILSPHFFFLVNFYALCTIISLRNGWKRVWGYVFIYETQNGGTYGCVCVKKRKKSIKIKIPTYKIFYSLSHACIDTVGLKNK